MTSLARFRVNLFDYADQGAGGVVTSTYTCSGQWWAAWCDSGGTAVVQGESLEHTTVRLLTVPWEAAPSANGAFQLADGAVYRILAINDRPLLRRRQVTGLQVNHEEVHLVGAKRF